MVETVEVDELTQQQVMDQDKRKVRRDPTFMAPTQEVGPMGDTEEEKLEK